ncbi:MAG TPA: response regulator [Thermoanaerobaculia bacterium]|nr:response regulator [Thermoanaerobaculia bacterium]
MQERQDHGVLVVEDDPAIRRLVTMVLQRHGYRIEAAADGLEAVLKLGVSEYDVIVLDLMMPNLDGFTFLNTLAENQPERLSKVIVTSAASPAVIRERMKDGAFRLLPKPFDINELVAAVHACIAHQKELDIKTAPTG